MLQEMESRKPWDRGRERGRGGTEGWREGREGGREGGGVGREGARASFPGKEKKVWFSTFS